MARPKKGGLSYFPFDVDFFSDNKIKILKARYKSDGIAIYIYLLCEIYKQGYYIVVNDDFEYIISDDLGIDQNKVKQVLNFLLKRSLFNDILFNSDKVLTSAGIQKRFQLAIKERARKNPIEAVRYWVLGKEETEPFIKCTNFEINTGNNGSFSGNNHDNSKEKSLKESKVNTYIYKEKNPDVYFTDGELNNAFLLYLSVRNSNGESLSDEQISMLKQELEKLSDKDGERTAIVKKAVMSNWKSFYPLSKNKQSSSSVKKKNKFNNFEGREYDMDFFEDSLLKSQRTEGGNFA